MLVLTGFVPMLVAQPARAFAPAAADSVAFAASRLVPAWPLDDLRPAVRDALVRHRALEALDPEHYQAAHRYDAATAAATNEALLPDAASTFGTAAAALREALLAGDTGRRAEAIAQLAIAASDLADPFAVTPPGTLELPGARARFEDAVDAALVRAPTSIRHGVVAVAGAQPAAVNLALESAALRPSVERAWLARDDDGVTRLQQQRIAAALGLVQAVVNGAWADVSEPPAQRARPVLRITPNPVVDLVTLSLTTRQPALATLEWFDLAGRRVATCEVGRFAPGPQRVTLRREQLGAVAPGVCYARLTLGDETAVARVVVLPR